MQHSSISEEIPQFTNVELTGTQVALLAFSTGGVVANIWYMQPLLSLMSREFHLPISSIGAIAMLGQIGTALGMFVFVPLGDNRERRRLTVSLVGASSLCLVLMAISRSVWWFALATLGVGLTGSIVHVIVPYAAHLASPSKRGATVGTVLSGLLLGILLSRTASGLLGHWFGWRVIYWVAAALMLVIAGLIARFLPKSGPVVSLSWWELIRSSWELVRTEPVLREASATGAIFFAAFNVFWSTLIFFLQKPPYHYGSGVAGLFGLVGAAGALGAPLIGRAADRFGARRNILMALIITLISFGVLYFLGRSLLGLILGVILLDFGVQGGHVSNQTRIYALLPEARSRLNMVYMICYFSAGAAGSFLSTVLWRYYSWGGVCCLGSLLILVGFCIYAQSGRKNP